MKLFRISIVVFIFSSLITIFSLWVFHLVNKKSEKESISDDEAHDIKLGLTKLCLCGIMGIIISSILAALVYS